MTGTPQSLPATPDRRVDALSDLLDEMRLSGMVLFLGEFGGQWAIDAPEARRLAEMLAVTGDCLIPFHLVASGECWIEAEGAEPVSLRRATSWCCRAAACTASPVAPASIRSRSPA